MEQRCTGWSTAAYHALTKCGPAPLCTLDNELQTGSIVSAVDLRLAEWVRPGRTSAADLRGGLPRQAPLPAGRPQAAWENGPMPNLAAALRASRSKATLIAVLVLLLAIATWLFPPRFVVLHNVLHHLNILPFMLAGLFFGWRGALKTMLFAVILLSPAIYRHWHRAPVDAQDQIVELSTFGAAGIIAGVLADRERMQRLRVETTKRELETVHRELQQNIEQLRKSERLTAAGELSASLAHEIRNPLASISGAAGILSRGNASPQGRAECLEILTKESQRLNKLLTHFLDFARPRLPRMQRIEAADLLHSVSILAQHAAAERDIEITLHAAPGTLQCDPEQIKQLLLNLLLNAIQASPERGRVCVDGGAHGTLYRIAIRDNGEGISAQAVDRIFEPFFTTKVNGTGLGLAIASTIAAQHNAALSCAPNQPCGTAFVLDLPCASAVERLPVAVAS